MRPAGSNTSQADQLLDKLVAAVAIKAKNEEEVRALADLGEVSATWQAASVTYRLAPFRQVLLPGVGYVSWLPVAPAAAEPEHKSLGNRRDEVVPLRKGVRFVSPHGVVQFTMTGNLSMVEAESAAQDADDAQDAPELAEGGAAARSRKRRPAPARFCAVGNFVVELDCQAGRVVVRGGGDPVVGECPMLEGFTFVEVLSVTERAWVMVATRERECSRILWGEVCGDGEAVSVSDLGDGPPTLPGTAMAYVDNFLYTSGGCANGYRPKPSKTLQRTNMQTLETEVLAPMPMARLGHVMVPIPGSKTLLMVAGGSESGAVDLYDVSTNTWRPVLGLSPPVAAAQAVTLDSGHIVLAPALVVGAQEGVSEMEESEPPPQPPTLDVHVWSPTTRTWSFVPSPFPKTPVLLMPF